MSTNVALGFALTPSYLSKVAFFKGTRDKVHLMVHNIKSAFKSRVNELEWIDDEHAKAAILDKISGAKVLIGFPPFIQDNTKLESLYQGLNITTRQDFLKNIVMLLKAAFLESGPHFDF